ncbi:SfnB family sulfur acquisition oxidoreductase [Cohnella mopanensis]|uniref:SfnB family sulfur acquisition oxidoreductase n=1 Tax=Cohnella mopanensis TaxID=2911966 RepID=UPI001EF852CC|nr:SfnB family sulfur acquisition oxidoreductase [Cohnella mopanensis]
MSIKLDSISLTRLEGADAIGLALQLGELQMDLRRKGITMSQHEAGNQIWLDADQHDAIRFENPAQSLLTLSRNDDHRVIGLTLQDKRETLLTRGDSYLRNMNDLRGAKLGIAYSRNPIEQIRKLEAVKRIELELFRQALTTEDVTWIELGGPERQSSDSGPRALQALLRGDVDVIYASGALAAEAQRHIGVREIAGFTSYSPELSVLSAPIQLIERHPEWVDRIIGHLVLAAEWASDNRKEANRLVAKGLDLSENAIESVFSEQLHKQFSLNITEEKRARLFQYKEQLLAHGLLGQNFDLDQALDRETLQRARSLIGRGEIDAPLTEPISDYADRDLPLAFFTDRKPARLLKNDEEAIEAAKAFAEQIKPGASDRDRYRNLPLEEMKRLAEFGLLGLVVPKAYGGPNVTTRTLVEVFKIISRADGAIGQIPQNHHFFVKTIELIGSDEQKGFFFEEVLNGSQFGNALAERGIRGIKNMSTRLRKRDGAGYELSGSKYYSTGALYSHWIPVTALDEEEKRMTVFVPRHHKGVTVLDDWSGIGQRTTASGTVILKEVQVSEEHILPHWRIFEGPQYFSAFGQIMHAAIDVGIAKAALEDAALFVREHARPSYNSGVEKASDEPDLIRRFGELGIRLQAAEALLDRAADAIDEARASLNAESAGKASLTVDSAKWLVTETAVEITNALFEVAGTSSMDRKHNYDRHWRNVRIHTLHDPARLKLHHVGKWFLNGVYHEYKV